MLESHIAIAIAMCPHIKLCFLKGDAVDTNLGHSFFVLFLAYSGLVYAAGRKEKKKTKKHTEHERVQFLGTTEHERVQL